MPPPVLISYAQAASTATVLARPNFCASVLPDEVQDEREIRYPKVRAAIQASHAEFRARKSRPATEFLSRRAARTKKRSA